MPILHLGRGHRGGYRHRRVRAGFQGLGFDGVSVPCDGETVRERMLMDGMDDIHAGEGEWERNGMNGVVWVRAGEGKRCVSERWKEVGIGRFLRRSWCQETPAGQHTSE